MKEKYYYQTSLKSLDASSQKAELQAETQNVEQYKWYWLDSIAHVLRRPAQPCVFLCVVGVHRLGVDGEYSQESSQYLLSRRHGTNRIKCSPNPNTTANTRTLPHWHQQQKQSQQLSNSNNGCSGGRSDNGNNNTNTNNNNNNSSIISRGSSGGNSSSSSATLFSVIYLPVCFRVERLPPLGVLLIVQNI